MSTFASVGGVRPYRVWDGAVARAVGGERVMLAVVDLEPDVAVPEHRHGNEQVGLVLQGSITMVVAGESRTLGPGETYVIAGDVPHSAVAGPSGATVVDVFDPPRDDWEQLERLEPSAGAWPA